VDAPETTRFRLTVHYDGSAFHGWQVQPAHRTVQGELEAALSRIADRPRTVIGSGRTDSGVHATGQVASVDMPRPWTAERLLGSLNALLSGDVWVANAQPVSSGFHPRYDALRRTYRYEIGLRPECRSPFHRRWCWPLDEVHEREPLERERLELAASTILGEHSFRAFAKAGQPERGYRCRVDAVDWGETALGLRMTITADRYLHHMVRYLVGTMVDIARGRRPAEDMARLLGADTDAVTSPPAPSEGLFLHRVEYPGDAATVRPEPSEFVYPSSRSDLSA